MGNILNCKKKKQNLDREAQYKNEDSKQAPAETLNDEEIGNKQINMHQFENQEDQDQQMDKKYKIKGKKAFSPYLDWDKLQLDVPDFITYLCPVSKENNMFLACAVNSVYIFDVNSQGFNHIMNFESHSKTVNMCEMFGHEKVIICSRDPIIHLYELNLFGEQEKEPYMRNASFKGHEMSVTTVSANNSRQFLASGSRDQTTRIWDVNTQQEISKRKIERNAITYVKWLPNSENQFIQCSEDLTLRLWDIRDKPFKPQIEFKVGTNFATNCDIYSVEGEDLYLVTGHRGFNNEGAEIKLWDLRSLSPDNLIYTYDKHKFSPEAVRFIGEDLIISASKDQSIHLINLQGEQKDAIRHNESFSSLAVLGRQDEYVVASDVKSNIIIYEFDEKSKHIRLCE